GSFMMKNTVLLGSLLALLDGNIEWLYENLETQFAKKGPKVVEFNKNFVKAGYEYVESHYKDMIQPVIGKTEGTDKQMVLAGNDAFCMGAILADCRFYAAYPMTPSSTVLTTMASWQDTAQIVVRHAEDEIAVINTALGASFAGVRAAVGTSGGGFALMVEGVSMAGITETPIVIFLSQRPGPATGMPTWTEQGDLLFAVNAGHGEFPKIVLAPGDVEEMIELTAKAFNLADIYQTPVIVMSDMLLSESHKSMSLARFREIAASYVVNRGALVTQPGQLPYHRYAITENGISPRLVPGTPGTFYQANSYEHEEDSHTTEHAQARRDQVEKRARKTDTYYANHFVSPRTYGDLENADRVIVCWGSTKGAALEAMKMMSDRGHQIACIHFTHMYPLESRHILPLFPFGKEYILIENNSHAQFGRLLRQETGIEIDKKFLKYDGRPIGPEEIVSYLTS
ncbi:2-oxoacid:acceptor oxidoreductase subunit alpha, partial [Candidatus Microgenomates bacterium]|nr:2-oxoacid:acceptor oxidoreductase subunit alpha [Candidatus Microgenomates bacterium]